MSIHPFREHTPSNVDLWQNYNNYFNHANNIIKFYFFIPYFRILG